MADETARPLLDSDSRPGSPHSFPSPKGGVKTASLTYQEPRPYELSDESAPLLHRRDDDDFLGYGGTDPRNRRASEPSRPLSPDTALKKRRGRIQWPILCAMTSILAVAAILVFVFIAPAAVKEYVKDATVFKPTNISIESTTTTGVRARIQGNLNLDARRIRKTPVRNLGRFVTWIGREVETGDSEVEVFLPEYGNVLVGTASLPPLKINIQNGHINHVDFIADLVAGDVQGIRSVALDWLDGRLGRVRLDGRATMHLKSGWLDLGAQTITDSIFLEEGDLPPLPTVNVTHFNVHDADTPGDKGAMVVEASVAAMIESPFSLNIPSLGFTVLVPNCSPGDPYIAVAGAMTEGFPVIPGQPTLISVSALIRGLPDDLTTACPGMKNSPFDFLVKSYVNGSGTTVYVRGADAPSLDTPDWMVDVLKTVTVPFQFTGHALDNLVRNFTMSDVHFSLPNPLAEPDSPESRPTVSALVKVLVGLPKELGLEFDVPRVRANADVFYLGQKVGVLDLMKWQPANSTLLDDIDGKPAVLVDFAIKSAPLEVTDDEVLTDLLQDLIFSGHTVKLNVTATVDAEVATGLGILTVREIPATGQFVVKPPYGGSLDQFKPQIESLELGDTSASSLLVKAKVNVTNPTPYAASVPFIDFVMFFNGSRVAHLTAKDVEIIPGMNSGLRVDLSWSPLGLDGPTGASAGRDLLSQYISGSNTTVTVRTHEKTIPALPGLGRALSRLALEVQIPHVPVPQAPGHEPDAGNGSMGFIQGATMHLWSSTAEFTLSSPFPNTTIEITSVDAQALYQAEDEEAEVGSIDYRIPFPVPPGVSVTPRMPVDLKLGGIGYDALKRALGGSLKLDAVAKVGVQIEHYRDWVKYHGKGIKAKLCNMEKSLALCH
ncbi:uncharacterized protein BP01DRAFT_363894 [Aspergillus saccharolyticus JOP 1030-1]|uniref:Pre-rRNA processing protein n=1 Tax=Aspergillus saccharolyticus JOP 1030-1 TaxID=1450539 RepID=A0A319ALN1_9EURO|nr:hypothetical protein BP01DRAFT_363894 [Aspergillus saccharolyticus JOP 1030-1]PYH47482.1 hypothetical protein BP01DRAFT_363894 [Aspergillus saccharolyticus JOP 1030-1]